MNLTPPAPADSAKVSYLAGWKLKEYAEVDSTNFVASRLPAWQAVRADTQTAGRGRFQRNWVSDAGGLWLSAVVPTPGDREFWQTLPLVAGLAVLEALKSFGLNHARLRWPNDIMVGHKKLAGLLLDMFSPELAVIGLGVNVSNQPADHDPALQGTATRLADLINPVPSLTELTEAVLFQLQKKMEIMVTRGFRTLQPRINARWGGTPRVVVDLDAEKREGIFAGVDDEGRLLLREDSGSLAILAVHQVKLLREV